MRKIGAFLCVILLFPCIVAAFAKGGDVLDSKAKEDFFVATKDGNNLSWEDYFLGRMAANIPVEYEIETLKAQAVVLRSQAAIELQEGKKLEETYATMQELKKTWNSEEYIKNLKKFQIAIKDTKREVLTYKKQIAMTPFHAISAGKTRNGAGISEAERYPYLKVVDCSDDKKAKKEINIKTFTYKEVQELCRPFIKATEKKNAERIFQFSDFKIEKTDEAGYVTKMKILDDIYSGEQFRTALGLASSAFSIQDFQGKLRITTMGCGHGFGMSLHMANSLAKKGKTYEEILSYFFGGTEIRKEDKIFLKLE